MHRWPKLVHVLLSSGVYGTFVPGPTGRVRVCALPARWHVRRPYQWISVPLSSWHFWPELRGKHQRVCVQPLSERGEMHRRYQQVR